MQGKIRGASTFLVAFPLGFILCSNRELSHANGGKKSTSKLINLAFLARIPAFREAQKNGGLNGKRKGNF